MLYFIFRRFVIMIFLVILISLVSFLIVQAPPGDYITYYVDRLTTMYGQREEISMEELDNLAKRWGLGQPIYVQYLKWFGGIIRGDLGRSMMYNGERVSKIIGERLPWSLSISFVSMLFVYLVAIPIGTFSATHQYSLPDYLFTIFGFIGIAIPNFLFALVLLYLYFVATGRAQFGLFSSEFIIAPWSLGKFWDLLKHLWMPAIVTGTAGTCGVIRIMRANLLDELQKPYVKVAQSKGISETKLLFKYPFRIAINPIISTIGWMLPALLSGELLTSLVLNIPTIAPIFLGALFAEDMFLAASIIFIMSFLTVIGTLISDILLAWIDPRIRESI